MCHLVRSWPILATVKPTNDRKNAYDGEWEYYVVVKEKGQREEKRTQEEIHRGLNKALVEFCFGLASHAHLLNLLQLKRGKQIYIYTAHVTAADRQKMHQLWTLMRLLAWMEALPGTRSRQPLRNLERINRTRPAGFCGLYTIYIYGALRYISFSELYIYI